MWAKLTPFNDFPDDVIADPETGATLRGAHSSFTDTYIMRLAETYLFRAEAYFRKGDLNSAAADINVVRARANAEPVSSGDVDLNYILDERLRELELEELRLMTLMRTGTVVERVRKYHPMCNGQFNDNPIEDYQNLLPIPQKEIERNTESTLQQNPGYAGGN